MALLMHETNLALWYLETLNLLEIAALAERQRGSKIRKQTHTNVDDKINEISHKRACKQ